MALMAGNPSICLVYSKIFQLNSYTVFYKNILTIDSNLQKIRLLII